MAIVNNEKNLLNLEQKRWYIFNVYISAYIRFCCTVIYRRPPSKQTWIKHHKTPILISSCLQLTKIKSNLCISECWMQSECPFNSYTQIQKPHYTTQSERM